MARPKKNADQITAETVGNEAVTGTPEPEVDAAQAPEPETATTKTPEVKLVSKNDTVFVALNHPQGIAFGMPNGRRVEIQGNAVRLRGKEKGVLPVGAFGLTRVDREDWEYIQKTYGSMPIFKSGLIFARDSKSDAADQAEDHTKTRHGREPVDVADPSQVKTQPAASPGDAA